MKFLRLFDFFDVEFHFYTNSQSGNYSIFGGIMFLLFLCSSAVTFILFSYDNLNKLNPITTKSESPDIGYRKVKTKDEKIWIPWRIATYNNEFIDHRGFLFPMIYSVRGKKGKKGEMNLQYFPVDYKLCNETPIANNTEDYKINVELNKLFCIDNKDLYLGGNWDAEYLYYLDINLYLCENGISYNETNPKCFPLINNKNNTLVFEFYYPEVRFQPSNFENPMMVIYRSHFYQLDQHSSKYERLYIVKNILSDQKSLFNSKVKNISFWGINSLFGDAYVSEIYQPLNINPSSKIFTLSIFMGKGLVYYTRTYKKILAILSDVFPLLNFLFFLFRIITEFVKYSFIRKKLFELLFENIPFKIKDLHPKKITGKKTFFSNSFINNNIKNNENTIYYIGNNRPFSQQNLNTIFINNININNKESNKEDIFLKDNNIKDILDISNNSFLDLNNHLNPSEIKEQMKEGKFHENDNIQYNNIIGKNESNNKKEEEIKKNRSLFPFFYYLLDLIINKLSNPKKFCLVSNEYLIVYKFVNQIYDISSYLNLYKDFYLFKNVFIKGKLNDIMSSDKKININNEKLMKELKSNKLNKKLSVFSKGLLNK